jgi:hypothetical protein
VVVETDAELLDAGALRYAPATGVTRFDLHVASA